MLDLLSTCAIAVRVAAKKASTYAFKFVRMDLRSIYSVHSYLVVAAIRAVGSFGRYNHSLSKSRMAFLTRDSQFPLLLVESQNSSVSPNLLLLVFIYCLESDVPSTHVLSSI